MAAQDNAALAREVYDLFNQGQLEQAADRAASDIEVVLVPFGQTFPGPDGFMGFMKGFTDAFPDIQVTVTNQVASDDQVVNECTWTGTHSGPLASPAGEIPRKSIAVATVRRSPSSTGGGASANRSRKSTGYSPRKIGSRNQRLLRPSAARAAAMSTGSSLAG